MGTDESAQNCSLDNKSKIGNPKKLKSTISRVLSWMIIYLDAMLPSHSSNGRVGRRVPRFPTLHPVLQSERVCHASRSLGGERCSLVSRTKHHLSFHLSSRANAGLVLSLWYFPSDHSGWPLATLRDANCSDFPPLDCSRGDHLVDLSRLILA